MNTRVSSKGQIVLPAELRELDAIVSGQRFLIERLEPGMYLLKRESNDTNAGLVDWLLACPDKDWFRPIPSESTDQL
jgi:AbrB family looped-hinge helix DNA binding protein